MQTLRQHSPAAMRNREPIREVLSTCLPTKGLVLEAASGSGEHAVHFARAFPALTWQPSDPDETARASIAAWREEAALPNLAEPALLDVRALAWPVAKADAMVCINMIHISPWESTLGLLAGAARVLPAGAPLFLYGTFIVEGTPTAPSNLAFDESLRARNPRWGVRELAVVVDAAERAGFSFERAVEMPANNLSVILRKAS